MVVAEAQFARIGRYEIIRRVGETGNVEELLGLAEDGSGRPCLFTLKVAQRIDGSAKDLAEDLGREVAILERLHHPTIVRMVELFEDDQRLVLALEYVEGGNLDELMRGRAEKGERLPDAIALLVGRELCAALAHAHAAENDDGEPTPVIHRNLQPASVLVGLDGRVRLTGFGIGKILGLSPDTLVGQIKGSPGYMAPEQASGDRVTPRTDVYGVALLVASMLLGRSARDPAPTPDELVAARDDLPEGVLQALMTALEPSPARRRTTCAEMEEWFAQASDRAEGQALLREELRTFRGGPASRPSPTSAPKAPAVSAEKAATALPLRVPELPPPVPRFPAPLPAPKEPNATPTTPAPPRAADAEPPAATTDALPESFPPPLPAPPLPHEPPPLAEPEPDPAERVLRAELEAAIPSSPPIARVPDEDVALSTSGSIALAVFAAAFVVGGGLLVTERDLRPPPLAGLPPAASASAATSAATPPSARPAPSARAAAASASARPRTTTAIPTTASAAPRPETLDATQGLLTIAFPTPGAVFANGERVGVTNAPLVVRCGQRFVRVAEPAEGGPRWLSEGTSITVGCRAATRKDMGPLRIAPPNTLGR